MKQFIGSASRKYISFFESRKIEVKVSFILFLVLFFALLENNSLSVLIFQTRHLIVYKGEYCKRCIEILGSLFLVVSIYSLSKKYLQFEKFFIYFFILIIPNLVISIVLNLVFITCVVVLNNFLNLNIPFLEHLFELSKALIFIFILHSQFVFIFQANKEEKILLD